MMKSGYTDPHPVSHDEREACLEFAVRIAEQAGQASWPFLRKGQDRSGDENKATAATSDPTFDPVTQADRNAEAIMRQAIGGRYPSHGLLGEGYGFTPGSRLAWVLDPVDGTRAFLPGLLHGSPCSTAGNLWSVSCIHPSPKRPSPVTPHLPSAATRVSCAHLVPAPSLRLPTPSVQTPSRMCSWTPPPLHRQGFEHTRTLVKDVRHGADCHACSMFAAEQIHLVPEAELKPCDVQAPIPIMERASGALTAWNGENPAMGGAVLASGNPSLHIRLLQELPS